MWTCPRGTGPTAARRARTRKRGSSRRPTVQCTRNGEKLGICAQNMRKLFNLHLLLGPRGCNQGRGVGGGHADEPLLQSHVRVPLADAEMVRPLGGDPSHPGRLRLSDGLLHAEEHDQCAIKMGSLPFNSQLTRILRRSLRAHCFRRPRPWPRTLSTLSVPQRDRSCRI